MSATKATTSLTMTKNKLYTNATSGSTSTLSTNESLANCGSSNKNIVTEKKSWTISRSTLAPYHTNLRLLPSFYPPFASIAKGEVFGLLYVCLFVCLFVNDFSTTRGPIHAKVCMRAYSGSGCVFSPFGGWRPPAGGKRGK